MPHEEIRKIIKVGNSFAITIPRAWLRYFELSEKNKVLIVSNGTITIKPRPQDSQCSIIESERPNDASHTNR